MEEKGLSLENSVCMENLSEAQVSSSPLGLSPIQITVGTGSKPFSKYDKLGLSSFSDNSMAHRPIPEQNRLICVCKPNPAYNQPLHSTRTSTTLHMGNSSTHPALHSIVAVLLLRYQ
ncbi:Phosphomethylpyrimidine synthase [Gossypium arboreum]|uniref:Phosphomethylpyrimidine synthase n=1 Tax=Gossypium arboreum TaxID=29729 RepID=A0A0B0MH33_GOSAR|nr:Phosphomethylpyrimidine synthase [Gossypium arboreum]